MHNGNQWTINYNSSSEVEHWSEWHAVTGGYPVPTESGVYCVRAVDTKGRPVAIQRALGEDVDGIVYFGEGKNLAERIGRLWWISDVDPSAHVHHPLISTWLHYDLDRLASRNHLKVRWKICGDHKKEEQRLIDDYKRKLGDLPVGNLSTGG